MKNEFLSTYVANNLRACQLKQLSILEEMDRICQKPLICSQYVSYAIS